MCYMMGIMFGQTIIYIASKGHGCQFCSRSDEPGKRFENFYGAIAIAQDK